MTKEHSRNQEELEGVTHLGNQNNHYSYDYSPDVLETFINKHPENDYIVTFDAYEFTSLCPMTGQPDFAKIFISYIPNERMVESKSLKLYLFSFRNHGDFHEDCMNIILNDLYELMNPKYIEVFGLFTPRGGISIYPFVNKVNPEFEAADRLDFAKQRKLQFLSQVQGFGRQIR
ncbi:MAG: preQ(1) synthase [Streptococcaceae bacterium]|nr:preQ(1) synthase [Streptococcaceae bacterium]